MFSFTETRVNCRCSNKVVFKMKSPTVALLLLCSWLACIATAFWYFEWRWIQPFAQQLAWFNGEDLSLGGPQRAKATVWHFYDKACPCNRYTEKHIQQLEQHYRQLGVKFVTIIPSSNKLSLLKSQSLPASPAIGIWDQGGKLAYFGPYSNGVLCNSRTSFIEPVLQQVLNGSNPEIQQSNGIGCFCPWPTYI